MALRSGLKYVKKLKVWPKHWIQNKSGWDLTLIASFCFIVSFLIWLYISSAPSVGVQIIVESSQLELGEVSPSWSVNGKADTNVSLQALRYVSISSLDSINGASVSTSEDSEQVRINASLDSDSEGTLPYVRLERLFLDGPAQVTFQQGANYFKLFMKGANVKPTHTPFRVHGVFYAPNGRLTQSSSEKVQPLDNIRPVDVIFNGKGEKETEWTFSGKYNQNYLNFNWRDIPVYGSISFREFGEDHSGTGLSTIRKGSIKLLETGKLFELQPRDFLDITLTESSAVSVDVSTQNRALVSVLTGRVSGLKTGRDAYPIDLMPSRIEVLANESRLVTVLTILSVLATLAVSIITLRRK